MFIFIAIKSNSNVLMNLHSEMEIVVRRKKVQKVLSIQAYSNHKDILNS